MKRHQTYGFTLIELLASMTLAAILMIAVIGLSSSVARTEKNLQATESTPPWLSQLMSTLQWEFKNAAKVEYKNNTLTITGHGCLESETMTPNHKRVKTTYSLKTVDNIFCLIRMQEELDNLTNRNRSTELVAKNIQTFDVQPLQTDNTSNGQDAKTWQIIIQPANANKEFKKVLFYK